MRRFLPYLGAIIISIACLAGAEWLASAIHLGDRIALLEDMSTVQRGHRWGSSQPHMLRTPEGFLLYKPWSGDGVTINELGLRTSPPTPKAAGEYRVALTGGSVVWGYLLADDDTIPTRLQTKIKESGRTDVTVYNFGVEGATIQHELALLKKFRDIYQIDHVIFYTGVNDIFNDYFHADGQLGQPRRPENFLTGLYKAAKKLELYKVAEKIGYSWFPPPRDRIQKLDDLIAHINERSGLVTGIKAARQYCQQTGLQCDFVLQPFLFTRSPLTGSEAKLASSNLAAYPKLDQVVASTYRAASNLFPFVHDFSASLSGGNEQVFFDSVHFNEVGIAAVAKTLLPLVLTNDGEIPPIAKRKAH
jgi:lysophospholipase L1-like esterase